MSLYFTHIMMTDNFFFLHFCLLGCEPSSLNRKKRQTPALHFRSTATSTLPPPPQRSSSFTIPVAIARGDKNLFLHDDSRRTAGLAAVIFSQITCATSWPASTPAFCPPCTHRRGSSERSLLQQLDEKFSSCHLFFLPCGIICHTFDVCRSEKPFAPFCAPLDRGGEQCRGL